MRPELAIESQWYKNLKRSLRKLLEENIEFGCRTSGVAISEALFYKLSDELKYDPDNLLGFKITVLDQSEFDEGEEIIILLGDFLN